MKPLAGIRVLDVSRLLPGPMCSWYMVGMGARVTKVEQPGMGDPLRHAPPYDAAGVGAWFSSINAGMESVALDLKSTTHRAAFRALLSDTDVLIEGFRPGVMKRLGLDPADLLAEFPSLVICSISGFGQDGPMASEPGHDLTYQACAGTVSVASDPPLVPGVLSADIGGGALTACMRICAALVERTRTGKGVWLDVSMVEGTLALMGPAVAAIGITGRPPVPGGEALTGGAPQYRSYRCRDGRYIAFAPLEEKFWRAFQKAIGQEIEPDMETLEALFGTKDRNEWVVLLEGTCCAPVLGLDELEDFPQHKARGSVTRQGNALRVSHPQEGGAQTAHLPSPNLGEHTEMALRRVGFEAALLEES